MFIELATDLHNFRSDDKSSFVLIFDLR